MELQTYGQTLLKSMNNDFPRGAGVSRPYERNSCFLHKNCSLRLVYCIFALGARKMPCIFNTLKLHGNSPFPFRLLKQQFPISRFHGDMRFLAEFSRKNLFC